ncbi:hypothetical protein BRADI_5g24683v3 [Brachypodium distachyon]|uniref:Uncharacterized protein n=1 Tax=Brachypodium distachyon TaxID=15368 RepID=A0A2K2CJ53_BRADI|nr:hypothetical protein BRADI_5g24683v3 [Brachypodium distachyon]
MVLASFAFGSIHRSAASRLFRQEKKEGADDGRSPRVLLLPAGYSSNERTCGATDQIVPGVRLLAGH